MASNCRSSENISFVDGVLSVSIVAVPIGTKIQSGEVSSESYPLWNMIGQGLHTPGRIPIAEPSESRLS